MQIYPGRKEYRASLEKRSSKQDLPEAHPLQKRLRGGPAGTLWHTGHLQQVVEEGGREVVLLSLVLALLTRVWQNSAELWHPYFRSDVETFRKQPKKS